MLYLFIGPVRNGKTVSSVVEAKKFFDEGYTVYSNTPLSFPYVELTREMIIQWEKHKIDFPTKSIALIDEIHAWFDSRNSMSSNNKTFSYFLTQLGKFTGDKQRGLTVIATTQYFTQLDIRGRRITYEICECKKVFEQDDVFVDVLRVWKRNDNLQLKVIKKELVRFTHEDFDLYNTQEAIKSE
jgi:SpoVK/Ycf46/Vps4 family AAA+-type ATPase